MLWLALGKRAERLAKRRSRFLALAVGVHTNANMHSARNDSWKPKSAQ